MLKCAENQLLGASLPKFEPTLTTSSCLPELPSCLPQIVPLLAMVVEEIPKFRDPKEQGGGLMEIWDHLH